MDVDGEPEGWDSIKSITRKILDRNHNITDTPMEDLVKEIIKKNESYVGDESLPLGFNYNDYYESIVYCKNCKKDIICKVPVTKKLKDVIMYYACSNCSFPLEKYARTRKFLGFWF